TVTRKANTRVIKKPEARPPLWRRIFTRKLAFAAAIITLIFCSIFAFFYIRYSALIDARLRGDVVVRTTGIYAAPHTIRQGSGATLASLKSYLDNIGYVDAAKEADSKRGRYADKGNALEIHSSSDAVINNTRQFPNVLITFGANGKGVNKITDLDSKRNLDQAQLEPEMMTAISNDKARQKQKLVSYKDLPKDYVNAVVAIEDRQFFNHSGINVRGIARALFRDVSEGQMQEGGSSITQQLVKNFFLTPERTLKRKLQEMMIAVTLETKLNKEEIFQLYANEIYMGQSGSYSINGVGEASSAYFNKDVVNLSLPEAAFLAGIIRGPSLYSPYRDPERARARRNQVLDAMVEAGFIPKEKAEAAKATKLDIVPRQRAVNSDAPYFVDYLQQELLNQGVARDLAKQSFRVYSTVDLDLQRAADKAVADTLTQLDPIFARRKKNPIPAGTLQAALVAMNPKTGDILAMVGGRDYGQSQLNRAVDANRQPGSVFKPIVYATALNTAYDDQADEKITAASLFMDAPETFLYGRGQTYSPENFGKTYSDQNVSLREGLTHSLNVVTVRVAEKVGYGKVARMAEKLGLPKPQAFPALALGTMEATPLQVAQAYTAFVNGGVRTESAAIKRMTNGNGVTMVESKPETQKVLTPEVAWLMTSIMQDVLNRGTAARARAMGFRAVAAGKTGTSRDGWFAGYTPNLVCVVWVGFDDNSELGLEGAKSALPIWTSFMKQALALRPELGGDSFPKPDSIVSEEIDPTTGMLATDECPTKRTEYFIEGTQPSEPCNGHSGYKPAEHTILGFEWPEGTPDRDSHKPAKEDQEPPEDEPRDAQPPTRKPPKKPADRP
ncbi:MAG TPA: PBP1A family penicillin-binding protein, partial [Blastocatellia bacterium]|nr:PBP1A family penicillin-binding protein [Blastocatellia bacterium]